MRALILIIATIAAAHQIVAAQTLSDPVGVRSGGGMPANRMQIETKSSQYDVPPKFISETGHTRDFRVLNTGYLCFANHAILAAQNWRFHPATKNGRPVSCPLRVPFNHRCN